MYSKTLGVVVLVLSIVLGSTACSLKVGEPDNAGQPAQLPLGEFSCMRDVGQVAREYFDGELQDSEINLFFDCISNAITRFEFLTEGEDKDLYSPKEVQNFLNDYLLHKNRNKISDDFMNQLMDFKVFMVGGKTNTITRLELKYLVDLIQFVKTQAINLNVYMPYYLGEKMSAEDVDSMDYVKAKQAFDQFSFEIGVRLSKSKNSYSLNSLRQLLEEVGSFLSWSEYTKLNFQLNDMIHLLGAFKSILVGGEGHYFRSSDWGPFFKQFSGWIGIYLDSKYFIQENIITYGPGLKEFGKSVNSGFSLLNQAVNRHQSGVIDYNRVDRLIEVLGDLDFIPYGIQEQTLKKSVRIFFDQVIRNPNYSDNQSVGGISASAISQASLEFSLWYENQLFMNTVLSERTSLQNWPQFGMEQMTHPFYILNQGVQDFVHSVDFGKDKSYFTLPKSLKNIVDNIRPFFQVNGSDLTLTHKFEQPQFNLYHGIHNLTYMNTIRAIARLLVRGWGTMATDSSKSGITEEKMIEFYDTVKDLGRDLQFMDPRSENSGARIFMEANLFTFSADGINDKDAENPAHHLLNFNEGLELLAFIYGNGDRRARFYENAIRFCGREDAPLDVFHQKKFLRSCFEEKFNSIVYGVFKELPHMTNYIRNISGKEAYDFRHSLYDISHIPCEDQTWMEISELGTISLVLSYVEALVLKYDKNNNNTLENDELWAAYPRFRGFIKRQIEKRGSHDWLVNNWFYTAEDFYQAVFKSIIASGNLPAGSKDFAMLPWEALTNPKADIDWTSVWQTIRHFNSEYYNSNYGVTTGRLGILKIFGSISKSTHVSKAKNCPRH